VFAARRAAKNVPAAHHHHHFHAEFAHFANLSGHVMHRLGSNADAMFIAERFAAQLEQNTVKLRSFGSGHGS